MHSNFTLHEVGLGSKAETKTFYKSKVTSGGHSFFRDQIFEKEVDHWVITNTRLYRVW